MATFTAYDSVNMAGSSAWRGTVTGATATKYTVSDATKTDIWTGDLPPKGGPVEC